MHITVTASTTRLLIKTIETFISHPTHDINIYEEIMRLYTL